MTTVVLTTGTDTFPGTPDDDAVNATASTLTAGDSLDGGDGHDTLVLIGAGTFDLTTLAQSAATSELRGEFVIVVAPPAEVAISADEADALLRQALSRVSLKDAVGEVADVTGLSRRELYQRALELTKERDHGAPR